MDVPFFGVDRLYKRHASDILAVLESVYSHGKVLMGSEVGEFEEAISRYCGTKYAVAVGSCTDALFFALKANGIGPGDEVLVTGFSFIASASPILRAAATPVFVDIEPDYYMMDLSDLEQKITPKTRAIIAVHLFGQTLAIDELTAISEKYGLMLIEDAAQSLGSSYNNTKAAGVSLCSCISFDPTKIIGAFGNGGVLLTDDQDIYRRAKMLHYHGKDMQTGTFEMLGYNSRMATSQAALLNLQLGWLEELIKARQKVAEKYIAALQHLEPAIRLPKVRPGCRHIFHKFVISTSQRDALREHLSNRGVQTYIHYPKAIPENPLFSDYEYRSDGLERIEHVKDQVLSLPIYPELTDQETDYVIKVIKDFFK